jgi:hypothetical protein
MQVYRLSARILRDLRNEIGTLEESHALAS